ncbi:MAG TPA: N-acetyl-1-D-myo-inositol-2-amino-2-deoxy-alpha-D-glucopyranoside deacetylase [Micromonosporaceae bacterium]
MRRENLPQRRILFVHAHPDDETITTGATMARYAAEGAQVTLVTCTLGEEGEIHVPALAALAAGEADQLGGYRLVELERACAALGVTDHRFLGAAGRYRDSGMMGTPANDHPRAFWRADLEQAARTLLEVIREVRPQVVVTYDEFGGYGHPDHIQAHRVTMRAVALAQEEGSGPAKVYWWAFPRGLLEVGMRVLAGSAGNPFAGVARVEDIPFAVPDEKIAAGIDAGAQAEAKLAAVRAHATQIPPTSWLFTLATNFGMESVAQEHYTLAVGERGPVAGANGWEDDLFAGLDVTGAP